MSYLPTRISKRNFEKDENEISEKLIETNLRHISSELSSVETTQKKTNTILSDLLLTVTNFIKDIKSSIGASMVGVDETNLVELAGDDVQEIIEDIDAKVIELTIPDTLAEVSSVSDTTLKRTIQLTPGTSFLIKDEFGNNLAEFSNTETRLYSGSTSNIVLTPGTYGGIELNPQASNRVNTYGESVFGAYNTDYIKIDENGNLTKHGNASIPVDTLADVSNASDTTVKRTLQLTSGTSFLIKDEFGIDLAEFSNTETKIYSGSSSDITLTPGTYGGINLNPQASSRLNVDGESVFGNYSTDYIKIDEDGNLTKHGNASLPIDTLADVSSVSDTTVKRTIQLTTGTSFLIKDENGVDLAEFSNTHTKLYSGSSSDIILTPGTYGGVNINPQANNRMNVYGESVFGAYNTNYTKIDENGHITFHGNATVFHDLLADVTNIKVLGTSVSLNTTESSIEYLDSADLNDYAISNYQMNHGWKIGSEINPHVHGWQTNNNNPNILIQYRWQQNSGTKVTTWTNYKCNTPVFTYVSGTLNQIWHGDGLTPPVGADLSDILQIRILRDTGNDSGVFSGADAYTGTFSITSADVHIEMDRIGSNEEFVA